MLREEQRELTTRKILGAVLELVAEGDGEDLSVPAVSRRSGVSLATIYRHFRTKDDLLNAAAAEPARIALTGAAREGATPDPATEAGFAEFQRAMWTEFATNLPLLRHQVTSTAGRDMRPARLDASRAQVGRYLAGFGIDPDTDEGRRLVSLVLLISGSLALVELHDRQGLPVDEALDTSLWAVRTLVEASRP